MTPRRLKQLAAGQPIAARVLCDGCRDYLIEVSAADSIGILRDRHGRALRFRSLGEVHDLLSRAGVREAVIRQRVAHDEVGAADEPARFHDQPIAIRAA